MPEPTGWTLVQPAAATAPDGWTLVQPAAPPGSATIGDHLAAKGNPVWNAYAQMGNAMGNPETVRGEGDLATGAVKGALHTAVGLGELVHRIPGVDTAVDWLYGTPGLSQAAFADANQRLTPNSTGERIGYNAEQAAEFAVPIGAEGAASKAAEVTKNALTAAAQGGTKGDVAITAALTAVPAGAIVRKAGQMVGETAEPLVRSALKPTISSMRRITGNQGMDAKANALVRFVLDNKLTTPDQARQVFQDAESELQRVLATKNAPTDAATRADRYLQALKRSAAKQGLNDSDVAAIENAGRELLNGPMGQDVVTQTTAMQPSTILGPDGKPVMVPVTTTQTTRELRPSVPADEALTSARASGRWSTRKAWGEQKGASMEAQKAVERAQRDATKSAIPETVPLLARQGQAIQATQALDRMQMRAGNTEPVSPFDVTTGAVEVAHGRPPVLAVGRAWLRSPQNKIRAGIWAKTLENAIVNGNAPLTADILSRLGVGVTAQMLQPATATP